MDMLRINKWSGLFHIENPQKSDIVWIWMDLRGFVLFVKCQECGGFFKLTATQLCETSS